MSKIKSLPLHLRPREKLIARGPSGLTNKELLAIILRTGRSGKSALDLAGDILSKYPLEKISTITHEELSGVKGVDIGKSTSILAAFELSRRVTKSFDNSLPVISCPQDAVDQLTDIRSKQKEHFVVLYLNARNQLIHREIISIGTLTASLVHPREVFEPAIRHLAAAVMLAHNHPSENVYPSKEDILLTELLVRSGRILDIKVLDHLIMCSNNYLSFKQKGMVYEQ